MMLTKHCRVKSPCLWNVNKFIYRPTQKTGYFVIYRGFFWKCDFSGVINFLAELNLILTCHMYKNLYIIYRATKNVKLPSIMGGKC